MQSDRFNKMPYFTDAYIFIFTKMSRFVTLQPHRSAKRDHFAAFGGGGRGVSLVMTGL